MTTKTIFHAFSYSPKNNVFWQVFLCKYARVIRIFSSLLLHWPVCQKWCAHDCIRNQKCCDRKFGTVLKKSRTEQNSCYCPDPKPPPPTPVRPRGAARTGEGGRLVGNLIGPRCLCEIFAMGWGALVLVAGPLLEPPVPPLVRFGAAPGPWCGASVGTTGSAPCALACRCFPKNVRTQLLGKRTTNPLHGHCASWVFASMVHRELAELYFFAFKVYRCPETGKIWRKITKNVWFFSVLLI